MIGKKHLLTAPLIVIAMTSLLVLNSCINSGRPEPGPEEQEFDYDSLYNSKRETAYPIVEGNEDNRARYGYTNSSTQGYNGWFYCFGESPYSEMTLDNQAWVGNNASINQDVMISNNGNSIRKFVVNTDGNITIFGNFKCADASSSSATITILKNDETIYSNEISEGDMIGKYFEIPLAVSKNDNIFFLVKGNSAKISLDPVITYKNSQNDSLYHLTSFEKFYGDLYPYYDDDSNTMYMMFIWSDNPTKGYTTALESSKNLLTYTSIPEANNFAIWDYVNKKLNGGFAVNRFIDQQKYPAGVRDNNLYFDEEQQRYVLAAGCYYYFNNGYGRSDLVLYASEDPYAVSWTPNGNVVDGTYDGHYPECCTVRKINGRWYVLVSVSHNSVHQVGALQYWVGDKGVDCMDQDWSKISYKYVDGEDLCAARFVKVHGKHYMYGWIPRLYNGMPNTPWGGFLNLPREVVVFKDGSLGSRMDEGLYRKLNYGSVFSKNAQTVSNESSFLTSGLNRNLVTFSMSVSENSESGFEMRQGGCIYRALVSKENGKTYLKVVSPNDPSHKVNSSLEIKDNYNGKFDVKFVCDGEYTEFYVNDEYALTAHINMTGNSYEAYLYSSGNASFSDLNISKLISQTNID